MTNSASICACNHVASVTPGIDHGVLEFRALAFYRQHVPPTSSACNRLAVPQEAVKNTLEAVAALQAALHEHNRVDAKELGGGVSK